MFPGEMNLLTFVLKGVLLTVFFLILTYLFRDRVILEGAIGYITIIFLVIPINLLVKSYVDASMQLSYDDAMFFAAGLLLGLNVVLLFAINRFLPGLTASNWKTLLVFIVIFTVGSVLVHHIPAIPGVPTWR